ncbi:class F sortase [Streptomyces anulatus]|uniref:class F sortase n=1 Tax=Streptomyces anulatus TaxID=1892 RepID=UPI00371E80F8
MRAGPPPRSRRTRGREAVERRPRPGCPGTVLLVGHVDSATRPEAFRGLSTLNPGDGLTLLQDDGSAATFTIRALRQQEGLLHRSRWIGSVLSC